MNLLGGIAGMYCPRCRKGRIFTGLYATRKRCSVCDYDFQPEYGYFLGAMVFSYIFGALSVIPTVIFLVFGLDASREAILGVPIAQIILTNPLMFHYSRTVWIYLDNRAEGRK